MFRILAQEGGPLEVSFGSFENTWLWIVLVVSLVALVRLVPAREGARRARGQRQDEGDRDRDPGGRRPT